MEDEAKKTGNGWNAVAGKSPERGGDGPRTKAEADDDDRRGHGIG